MKQSSSFRKDQQGSVAVMVAAGVLPMMLFIGFMIDSSAGWLKAQQSAMGASAAAAIVALHNDAPCNSTSSSDETKAAYKAASGSDPADVAISCENGTYSATGHISTPLTLMRLGGKETLAARGFSQAHPEPTGGWN